MSIAINSSLSMIRPMPLPAQSVNMAVPGTPLNIPASTKQEVGQTLLGNQSNPSVQNSNGISALLPANQTSSNKTNASQAPQSDPTGQAKTPTEQQSIAQVLSQLKARDQEVKAHEAAHLAVGGQYVTSGASYSYQTGPDGQRYAVGGEVSIDTSPIEGDPHATIAKAQQVQSAALAPTNPSSQDFRVASAAIKMMTEAQMQAASENRVQFSEASQPNQANAATQTVPPAAQPKNIAPNTASPQNLIPTPLNAPGLVDRQVFEMRRQVQA